MEGHVGFDVFFREVDRKHFIGKKQFFDGNMGVPS